MTRNMKKLYTIINYCKDKDCNECFMASDNLCMFRNGLVPCSIKELKFPNRTMYFSDIDGVYAVMHLSRMCGTSHCKQCEFYEETPSMPCLFTKLKYPYLWPGILKRRAENVHKAQETNL